PSAGEGVIDGGFRASQLAERPCLEWTAPRGERRVPVGDLGHVAEAGCVEVRGERLQIAAERARLGRWILGGGEGGVDEWADEPRPDRALVVGLVAIRGGARTRSAIARLTRRQRSQAEGRQQRPPHDVDDAPSAIAADHAYRQAADGQDLIGSQCRVRAARDVVLVHDVEEAAALLVPETAAKRVRGGPGEV